MNTHSHFNLSYAAGFVIGKVFHPVGRVVDKVAHAGPVKRAWELARPIRRAARLVKIGVLYPFDWLFFGGIGVLWRTREEWREIFRDALEHGKPLPNFHLDAVEEEDEFRLPGTPAGCFAMTAEEMARADEDGVVMYSDPLEGF